MGQNFLARIRGALRKRRGKMPLALTGSAAACAVAAAVASVMAVAVFGAPATPQPLSDAEQRATDVARVVLGMISYTRWPTDPAELRMCIVPPTDYAQDLSRAASQASGRPIRVALTAAENPDLGTSCDVVYIGSVSDAQRDHVLASLSGHPILSISEQDSECTVGSVFCLNIRGARISFKVNLDSLARSGVRVNPSVLQLAGNKAVRP